MCLRKRLVYDVVECQKKIGCKVATPDDRSDIMVANIGSPLLQHKNQDEIFRLFSALVQVSQPQTCELLTTVEN